MEKMPYRSELDLMPVQLRPRPSQLGSEPVSSSIGGRRCRCLRGEQVVLRELRASDAPSLFALLTTEEVSRFISPPPTTVEGFERFIAWTLRQRAAGTYACFAVTVRGFDTAIGIFQVREIEPGFGTAEWGFAIGSAFWGTRRVSGGRRAGARVRVRHARRAPARSARGGPERPRQRRAAEDRRRPGSASCASRSSATASTSTRRSTRFSTATGAHRRVACSSVAREPGGTSDYAATVVRPVPSPPSIVSPRSKRIAVPAACALHRRIARTDAARHRARAVSTEQREAVASKADQASPNCTGRISPAARVPRAPQHVMADLVGDARARAHGRGSVRAASAATAIRRRRATRAPAMKRSNVAPGTP